MCFPEVASFEGGLEEERAVPQAQAEVQVVLPLEPNDSSGPMVLEASVVDKHAV